jgi:uncharacterized membrane protein
MTPIKIMKLSETDLQILNVISRRRRRWSWLRWWLAGGNLVLVVLWMSLLAELIALAEHENSLDSVLAVAWLSPLCWILLVLIIFALAYTVLYWRGDRKTALLVRMAEELLKKSDMSE